MRHAAGTYPEYMAIFSLLNHGHKREQPPDISINLRFRNVSHSCLPLSGAVSILGNEHG